MLTELLTSFVIFFTVIDPIGTIPVFIAVTAGYSQSKQINIAIKAFFVSIGVLLFFILAGEFILTAAKIPLSTFQIAGGLVLFLFALSMIFGDGKPKDEISNADYHSDQAIFPLAIPSLASPGAMLAAVLLTENSKTTLLDQFLVSLTMIAVMIIALIFMMLASKISKIIGQSGAAVISRVMGIILSSVAVSNILQGIKTYFSL